DRPIRSCRDSCASIFPRAIRCSRSISMARTADLPPALPARHCVYRATERGDRLRDSHPCHCPSCRHGFSMTSMAGSSGSARSSIPTTAARPGVTATDRAHPSDSDRTNAMAWYRFGEWNIERRFRVLLVVGALTVFFGYFAAQTQLVTSFGDLLPKNHPFIKSYEKYEEFFGGTNTVT